MKSIGAVTAGAIFASLFLPLSFASAQSYPDYQRQDRQAIQDAEEQHRVEEERVERFNRNMDALYAPFENSPDETGANALGRAIEGVLGQSEYEQKGEEEYRARRTGEIIRERERTRPQCGPGGCQ